MKKNIQKGFSLLEIILTIVLVAAVLAFAILYYQTSQVRADINTNAATLVSYLRLVQSNAMAGHTGKANAVHLEGSSYATFPGATYNPSDPANYTIDLPPTITIENISLNGDGTDIIFSSPAGETTTYGTLDLVSNQINKTITINIASIGTINY